MEVTMNKSIPTAPQIKGHVVTENGTQYFVMGKNCIKITEHFPPDGKQLDELIAETIMRKSKGKSS